MCQFWADISGLTTKVTNDLVGPAYRQYSEPANGTTTNSKNKEAPGAMTNYLVEESELEFHPTCDYVQARQETGAACQ